MAHVIQQSPPVALGWGTTITLTPPAATQPGSTLVLYVATISNQQPTITDSAGNTWTHLGSTATAGAASQRAGRMYICEDAAPVTTVTLTGPGDRYVASLVETTPTSGWDTPVITHRTPPAVASNPGDLTIAAWFYHSTGTLLGSLAAGWTRLTFGHGSASAADGAWRATTTAGTSSPVAPTAEDIGYIAVNLKGAEQAPQDVHRGWTGTQWVDLVEQPLSPTAPPAGDAWDLATAQGTISPNLIVGRWYDTQWTGSQPTHSGGIFTSSRPATASAAQWRSETYAAGDDYVTTSGRVQLQRYERFVMDFEVNLATGYVMNDNDSHDVIAQLIGRTTANFWPGPPMALVFQNGTFRIGNNPTPFGPNEEMTSINGSGVAGRLNLGASNTLGQWHRFIISIYLDGPGQGTVDMWANGVHYCQGWKPTAGTWYTHPSYTHEFVFPKIGMYGAAGGARPAKTTQHRNLRMSRHQGSAITTQRSAQA